MALARANRKWQSFLLSITLSIVVGVISNVVFTWLF